MFTFQWKKQTKQQRQDPFNFQLDRHLKMYQNFEYSAHVLKTMTNENGIANASSDI